MHTQLIYNYLADLKTGYCNTIEEYKQKITASEIGFRAAYTQYLAETDGKGYNLILNDFRELEKTLRGLVKERLEENLHEQCLYALEKTIEAVEYIKTSRTMYETGNEQTPQQNTSIKVADTKVISSTEGLARFLGCGKSMAFSVIKSGILIENGIQYKVGNTWKFNAERLEHFLREHPHFLQDIRCIR